MLDQTLINPQVQEIQEESRELDSEDPIDPVEHDLEVEQTSTPSISSEKSAKVKLFCLIRFRRMKRRYCRP
jgi:hypothetical protein